MRQKKNKIFLADFHSHSLLSDGALLPSELVRRYDMAGFSAVAITDHADSSNIDFVLSALAKVSRELNKYWKIRVIPGVELTHIPLESFAPLTKYARKNGAKIIVAHGETPVEPVIKGTNRAAIEAGVDIVAHPGRIKEEDARLAAKRGVYLEITTRRGHCKTNSHVAAIAKRVSAGLIIDSDSHSPLDIPDTELFMKFAKASGLSEKEARGLFANAKILYRRLI